MKKKITLSFITLFVIIFSAAPQSNIVKTTPANGSTGVALDAEVSVTLDKEVTILQTSTPIPGEELNKSLFQPYVLPGDEPSAYNWELPGLWDNNVNTGFHTASSNWPQWITFDLGVTVQLSKFRYWQRQDHNADAGWDNRFNVGNVKKMKIWGSTNPNPDGSWDSWVLLTTAESVKPSGLPVGQVSPEDIQVIADGEEFIFPADVPAVRYIRIEVLETWGGLTDQWHIMEMTFWEAQPTIAGVTIEAGNGNKVSNIVATANDEKITIAHAPFEYETEYTVTIPSGAIADHNGAISWTFTSDVSSLRVVETTPANNKQGVTLGAEISVTLNKEITIAPAFLVPPFFKPELDKMLFKPVRLPGDEPSAYGWELPDLWDNNLKTGFHTASSNWPQWITFDLGVTVQLGSLRYWQRGDYAEGYYDNRFNVGNVKKMEIWGSTNPNPDGSWDDSWILLTTAQSVKPSALPLGSLSEADIQVINNGETFQIPSNTPAVRYIRIKVLETWGGDVGQWYIMEMAFWGAPPTIAGITIKDESGVAATGVSATSDGKKISIAHNAFSKNAQYTVTIPSGRIVDYDEEIIWSFSTILYTGITNVAENVDIYPTISKGTITVDAPVNAKITILNILGKKLDTYKSEGKTPISLNYSNGVYIVVIDNADTITTRKVILKK
jgi:hypothetical protein